MASSNYTSYYHLPQWAATDPFLREDFNSAFHAIDSGIGSLNSSLTSANQRIAALENSLSALQSVNRYALLQTVTLSASSTQIGIDLSGVDWSVYPQVLLHPFGISDGNGYTWITLNNDNSSNVYKWADLQGATSYQGTGGLFWNSTSADAPKFITILLTGGIAEPEIRLNVAGNGTTNYVMYSSAQALHSIELNSNANTSFCAGFGVKLYGLRF